MDELRFDELSEKINEWSKYYLGEDFEFRPHQLKTVAIIIDNVLNNTKITCIESPTGSGKSIIGIIAAGVLEKYYNKSSYILISDTTLFKQYEKDVKKYNLPWGCLEGKDNFTCLINGQSFSKGKCQMKNTSLRQLTEVYLGEKDSGNFFCAKKCKYINEYYKARTSRVSIMTYQYLLSTYINMPDNFCWGDRTCQRDVVFCDEAHKLPDIIQNMFSPRIGDKQNIYLSVVQKFLDEHPEYNYTGLAAPSSFKVAYDTMVNIMSSRMDGKVQRENMLIVFKKYLELLNTYHDVMDDIVLPGRRDAKIPSTKVTYSLKNAANQWFQDISVFKEYSSILGMLGSDYCVTSLANGNITYNCSREPDMVKKFFHAWTNCEVLLSATIGNVDVYRETIGAENLADDDFYALEVPSTFNFDRSPIFYNVGNKMSMTEKLKSLPNIMNQIINICRNHKTDRILVQTGSYALAKDIYAELPSDLKSRTLLHNNSDEKKEQLKQFESYMGRIFLSPSMLEGWDGKDDKCRVLIIAKVPYASLGDALVKDKQRLYPNWYNYVTANSLIQGIGRGVRSEDDWCITYILDGCFNTLYQRNKELIPPLIQDRLVPL